MAQNEPSIVTEAEARLASTFAARQGDPHVVHLRGEHDASTVVELSATIARAMALDDADVVLDLSEVQFMDAATVGVIVLAVEFLNLRSRTLTLWAPSRCARHVIELCGLAALLGPHLTDAPRPAGQDAALSTWVEVPVALRADAPAAQPTVEKDSVHRGPRRTLTGARRTTRADPCAPRRQRSRRVGHEATLRCVRRRHRDDRSRDHAHVR